LRRTGAEVKPEWGGPTRLLIRYKNLGKHFGIDVYKKERSDNDHQVAISYIEEKP